jgi:hypothetical protein
MSKALGQILVGGMGAMSPRRGSTPRTRPNQIGCSYRLRDRLLEKTKQK